MAFLASEPLGFGDGNTLQTDLLQGFFDLVQLERFDDRLDFFHVLHRTSPLGIPNRLGPRAFARSLPDSCRRPSTPYANLVRGRFPSDSNALTPGATGSRRSRGKHSLGFKQYAQDFGRLPTSGAFSFSLGLCFIVD